MSEFFKKAFNNMRENAKAKTEAANERINKAKK